ncbi:Uncharacterised protein [Pseudomonas aeruginosa]|nr:Uncharacterised protein [Pseudomonas aeruginosa]
MRGVGVAVAELHRVLGQRLVHEGVVDLAAGDHRAHRHGAVGDLLGDVHQVRGDAEVLGAAVGAQAAEGGDHLVEDQQDVVLVADLAQALQVADRRYQYAGGAGHRLDDHRGDVRGVVQFDQLEQLVGQLDAAGLGHPAGERHARLQGVRQVVDVHQLAEHLAVAADPAEAGAGDVDPVVAAGAADQLGLLRLAFQAPVGAGHLDRGVGALGAGTGQEHVVQFAWQQPGDLLGQLEGQRMAVLEARRVVEGTELASHRLLDFLARVAGAAGPQAGQAVVDLATLVVGQPAAFGGDDDPRVLLEVAVGGEGHPVGAQVEFAGNRRGHVERLVHRSILGLSCWKVPRTRRRSVGSSLALTKG